jgi:hypothetical protein
MKLLSELSMFSPTINGLEPAPQSNQIVSDGITYPPVWHFTPQDEKPDHNVVGYE